MLLKTTVATACKLPYKCCIFVVSFYNSLITFLCDTQPPTTVSPVTAGYYISPQYGGISQRRLGICIQFLGTLLHYFLRGVLFLYLWIYLLQQPQTPNYALVSLTLTTVLFTSFHAITRATVLPHGSMAWSLTLAAVHYTNLTIPKLVSYTNYHYCCCIVRYPVQS